jgi:hypothetical protein
VLAIILWFFKPRYDKTSILKLVQETIVAETNDIKAMIANLATVMDIRLDTIEEKHKIKQTLVDEVGAGRRYISNTKFLRFYNYYMSTIVDLSMRFYEGNSSDVKQYDLLKSHLEVKLSNVMPSVTDMMGQSFSEAFSRSAGTTVRLWLEEVHKIYADRRDNKVSRLKTLNIKLVQDIIQDIFTLGDKKNLLNDPENAPR